jgi:hypothetical protein
VFTGLRLFFRSTFYTTLFHVLVSRTKTCPYLLAFFFRYVDLNACVQTDVSIHHSLLQGHILQSRGPRHPQPAPLVLQVRLSPYITDWGEGLGSLVDLSCISQGNIKTRQKRPSLPPPPSSVKRGLAPNKFSPFLPLLRVGSLKRNSSGFEALPSRQPPPLPAPLSRGLLSSGLFGRDFMSCRCHRVGCPSSSSLFAIFASCRCLVVLCLVSCVLCLVIHTATDS